MQYFITYVLGYRSSSGKKAVLGTMVHKVMEVLAGLKKFQQDNPKRKYLEIVDDVCGKVKVHVDTFASKEFVEEIADVSYEEYGKQESHIRFTKADRKEISRLIWLTLDFDEGSYDPRNRNVLFPEPHFDIPIEEDWAKFEYELPDGKVIDGQLAIKGTIDLVTSVTDDIIEVIDWKTGQRKDWATGEVKTYEKLQKDAQLLLYNYAISKKYPEYKQAIMTIFYVKDGGPFTMCFDETDQTMFLNMLKNRFEEIKADIMPKPISPEMQSWKCKKLCHFCKNNWEGTNVPMCKFVQNSLKAKGMEQTVKDCTKPGHSIGYYEAPG